MMLILLLPLLIFGYYQKLYKILIVICFILYIQCDIFGDCLISYYEKKKLNKNYKSGDLPFLTPDFPRKSKSQSHLNFSVWFIAPLISFILLKKKSKLLCILIFFITLLFLKHYVKFINYFKKYNIYGEEI